MDLLYRYTSNVEALYDDEGVFLEPAEQKPQKVILSTHPVLRQSKNSYWITDPKTKREKRITKNAKSTFAYDTKAKALNNYKHRCASNFRHCRRSLEIAQTFYENSKGLTLENVEL